MLFIQLIYYFFRDRVPINNFPPFSAHKHTHNPQFLHSLQRRANARSFSFETLINVRNQLNWYCNTIWPFYNSLTHNEVKGSLELRPWSFRTTFHELLTKEKHLRNERYVWSETKPQKISALPHSGTLRHGYNVKTRPKNYFFIPGRCRRSNLTNFGEVITMEIIYHSMQYYCHSNHN